MMHRLHHRGPPGVTVVLVALLALAPVRAAEVKDSLKVVSGTNRSAVESQKKIDNLSRETRDLLEEYRRLQDGTEYQEAFTRELEELDRTQTEQIAALEEEIARARITRQRILPLMRSMADALERFVVLDLPFHHEDRINAVLVLKQRLNQPDLSVSARFRLLLEAFQVEQDYGDRIEAWRGPLQLRGEEVSVQFLRVGRVALYFQSLDGATSGYWNGAADDWEILDASHNRAIVQALRVARNQSAPRLLQLPLTAPEGDS